jgi:RNA polymerase sigma factor (sigma-70 family)
MKACSDQCDGKTEESMVWEKFRKGDQTSLGRIFSTCYVSLFQFGTGLVKDEELVEDCIQNLFEKLWHSRERLQSIESIRPYLFKCLRYQLIDQIREKKKKAFGYQHFDSLTTSISSEDSMIAEQSEVELKKKVLHSLTLLSSRQRQAVYLKIFEDMEYDKISGIMMLNVQSARNLVHQAFKTLKTNRSQFGFYD